MGIWFWIFRFGFRIMGFEFKKPIRRREIRNPKFEIHQPQPIVFVGINVLT